MSDFRQILSQAKQQINEVSPQEVREKLNPANGFTLLDAESGQTRDTRELAALPGQSLAHVIVTSRALLAIDGDGGVTAVGK